jgi:CBS domain containing-hemolysin-like protein
MTVLVLVVVITLLVSAMCSLFEATLYSTRMGALEAARAKGRHRSLAGRMIQIKQNIAIPISSILILNTIANTAGATIAGMYAHKVLGQEIVPAFSVVFTLVILFFSEITPKTLGVLYWRRLWPAVVWPLTAMKYLLFPAISLTRKFTALLSREGSHAPISEDEILGMIRLGAMSGEISQWEGRMAHNIINLEDKPVADVLTPRTMMFTLDADTTVREALEAAGRAGFTRIPIYKGDREDITGYVMVPELGTGEMIQKPDTKVGSLVRPISFVSETSNCLALMAHFLKRRQHIAIVHDKYGGVAGLVTLEDLLETILGAEIVDETDRVVDLQRAARIRKKKTDTPAEDNAQRQSTLET